MNTGHPLVSIVTPVYNGEKYLSECIESVLNQDYPNWEYVIVDNCSTDATLEIATRYAGIDDRVRTVSNERFVDVIENHNIAFRCISKESRYCKVISADDWIYPECITKMTGFAEEHPNIAIVGCYAISNDGAKHIGLPPEKSVFTGRDVCRLYLLGGPQILGAPTAFLYRSDVVRSELQFFPSNLPNADAVAAYRVLQQYDFGFVHQILAYERIHPEAISTRQAALGAFRFDEVEIMIRFGRHYLTAEEYYYRSKKVLDEYYYDVLAAVVLKSYPNEAWSYHLGRLKEIGIELEKRRLAKAVAGRVFDLLGNPKRTAQKFFKRRSAVAEAKAKRHSK
jgi:glycosyltransferase involved in cell wall biosynthesis